MNASEIAKSTGLTSDIEHCVQCKDPAETVGGASFSIATGIAFVGNLCYDCHQRQETARNADRKSDKVLAMVSRWDDETPCRYRGASVDGLDSAIRAKIREWISSPRATVMMLWSATPGTGKTWATYALCRRCHELALPEPMYHVTPDLATEIRDQVRNGRHDATESARQCKGVLVLDDFGAEVASEYVTQEFYRILDYRDRWLLKTAITTNVSPDALDAMVGQRIASRIRAGISIELTGTDRRMQRAGQ